MEDLTELNHNHMAKIVDAVRVLDGLGCAVVIFTKEELRGANPNKVEERLVELGWDVIDTLATEPREGE